jgi:PhzF family phenazine biosynthesis protein
MNPSFQQELPAGIPYPERSYTGYFDRLQPTLCVWRAFTGNGAGGNRAGVVFPANRLSAEERQAIASEPGYSETAFVDVHINKNGGASFAIEFFTPLKRIEMCGHALATAGAHLASLGLAEDEYPITSPSGFGLKPHGRRDGGKSEGGFSMYRLFDDARSPLNGETKERACAAVGLSLEATGGVRIMSAGRAGAVPFLFIETTEETLLGMNPDLTAIKALSEALGIVGFYVYRATRDQSGELHIRSRMFAPAFGINEEAATGMAAAPLAMYLAGRSGNDEMAAFVPFSVRQGIGRPEETGLIQGVVGLPVGLSPELTSRFSEVELRAECTYEGVASHVDLGRLRLPERPSHGLFGGADGELGRRT